MDAVPIVPPLFRAPKTRHFTSYKHTTDHELLTITSNYVALAKLAGIEPWMKLGTTAHVTEVPLDELCRFVPLFGAANESA
jgi:hypothetical protein